MKRIVLTFPVIPEGLTDNELRQVVRFAVNEYIVRRSPLNDYIRTRYALANVCQQDEHFNRVSRNMTAMEACQIGQVADVQSLDTDVEERRGVAWKSVPIAGGTHHTPCPNTESRGDPWPVIVDLHNRVSDLEFDVRNLKGDDK